MLLTTRPPPGGRAVSRKPWRLPKGSLSVSQGLGFRQVSEQRAQCTLTPAGSRPPSGRGVSVKTAERGGSLSGSGSAGAGVEREAAPHRAEGEKGKALAGVPGAGSVGATGGGVTHLTTISGCSFPTRGLPPQPACGGRVLTEIFSPEPARDSGSGRGQGHKSPPNTGGCGCHLSLAATRKCIHMAPPLEPRVYLPRAPCPRVPRWTQGAGERTQASSLKPQTPSPSRQTAPERTRRGRWVHPQGGGASPGSWACDPAGNLQAPRPLPTAARLATVGKCTARLRPATPFPL